LGRAGIDGILMVISEIGAIEGSLEIHLTAISTKTPAKTRIQPKSKKQTHKSSPLNVAIFSR
jgi:hypothetical protein